MTAAPKPIASPEVPAAAVIAGSAPCSAFEIVAIKFRDIPDVINRRKQSRTFQSRHFRRDNRSDEESAIKELWASARKYGLTEKEVIKVVRRDADMPNAKVSDRHEHHE